MSAWPTYARFLIQGAGESFADNMIRTEMERGVPKMRRLNSHVMVDLPGEVAFFSQSDIAAFDTWFFSTIREVGWFDFVHPRTGATVQARVKTFGPRTPHAGRYSVATQQITLEYLR